jgi:hypothetical protein
MNKYITLMLIVAALKQCSAGAPKITGIYADSTATGGPWQAINSAGLTGTLHDTNFDSAWLSSSTNTPHWVVLELATPSVITAIRVWNLNVPGSENYQLGSFVLETSTDDITWTGSTEYNVDPISPSSTTDIWQDVSITSLTARYIRLSYLKSQTFAGTYSHVGFSEIALIGTE